MDLQISGPISVSTALITGIIVIVKLVNTFIKWRSKKQSGLDTTQTVLEVINTLVASAAVVATSVIIQGTVVFYTELNEMIQNQFNSIEEVRNNTEINAATLVTLEDGDDELRNTIDGMQEIVEDQLRVLSGNSAVAWSGLTEDNRILRNEVESIKEATEMTAAQIREIMNLMEETRSSIDMLENTVIHFPPEGVTIELPFEASNVELYVCSDNTPVRVTIPGTDLSNTVEGNECKEINFASVEGQKISTVRLTGGGNEARVQRIRLLV